MKKVFSVILCCILSLTFCNAAFAAQTGKAADGKWIAAWGTSPVDYSFSLEDYVAGFSVASKAAAGSTIRTEIVTSAAGEKLRLKFSNQFGEDAVSFSSATVARTNTLRRASVKTESITALTFSGADKVTIPAGGYVWSDAVDFTTEAFEELSVSIFFERTTNINTAGLFCGKTYMSEGYASQSWSKNIVAPSLMNIASGGFTYHIIPLLTELDVYSENPDAFSAVVIGDSTVVNDCTQFLSERLVNSGYDCVGVINEGIMGNRLLYEGAGFLGNLYGNSLESRFEQDALSVSGCEVIIVKIGINDITHPTMASMNGQAPYASVEEIIAGYEKLIERAHDNGQRIYFMEITPFHGYIRSVLNSDEVVWRYELQEMCDAVNEWIHSNNSADGYIDSSALASPADYTRLRTQFTKDGIHLSTLGAAALADSVDMNEVFGLSGEFESCSQISRIDIYDENAAGILNSVKQMLNNVMLFVRQLLLVFRIEFEPLDRLIDSLSEAIAF